MTQLDDQTTTDESSPSTAGPSLAERVAAKLDHDGVSPANAAMTIGVSYPQLVSLLGGKKPPMKALLRIEAWLQGQAADESGDAAADADAPDEDVEHGIVEIVQEESPLADPQAPAPRRRGRPPKAAASPSSDRDADADASVAPPRKRGRPPKAASAAADATSPPKRRGRPPKARDADAAPKRRGRPPKAGKAEKADRADASSAAPKRRGRPPKDRSASEKTADAAPKRRGRPPKHPPTVTTAEPKRRGRPPGTKNPSAQGTGVGLGAALRELVAIADDTLAVAIHRASKDVRARVSMLLDG